MSDHVDEVERLMAEADGVGQGAARLVLLEEAVRLADAHRDDDLAFHTRQALIGTAYEENRYEQVLAHFAWCLGYADRHPEQSWFHLLWQYRMVIDSMPDFPEIPRTQIESALDDMAGRYTRTGFSLRGVEFLRSNVYRELGDETACGAAIDRALRERRDVMSDSIACETMFQVYFHTLFRRHEEAVRTAGPFLDGRFADPFARTGALADVLLSLAVVGRREEAVELQKTIYRQGQRLKKGSSAHDHLGFLSAVGELSAAVRVFERHSVDYRRRSRNSQFYFLRNTRLLCDRLPRLGHTRKTLRVPADFLPDLPEGRYLPADLLPPIDRTLAEMARTYDRRNGNDHYAGKAADLELLNLLADRLSAAPTEETP